MNSILEVLQRPDFTRLLGEHVELSALALLIAASACAPASTPTPSPASPAAAATQSTAPTATAQPPGLCGAIPSGASARCKYTAVASPSMSASVAMITSATPSSRTRSRSCGTWIWSGPIPSIGEITPCSTKYSPLNSEVRSTASTSSADSTTRRRVASRRVDEQIQHRLPSAML